MSFLSSLGTTYFNLWSLPYQPTVGCRTSFKLVDRTFPTSHGLDGGTLFDCSPELPSQPLAAQCRPSGPSRFQPTRGRIESSSHPPDSPRTALTDQDSRSAPGKDADSATPHSVPKHPPGRNVQFIVWHVSNLFVDPGNIKLLSHLEMPVVRFLHFPGVARQRRARCVETSCAGLRCAQCARLSQCHQDK